MEIKREFKKTKTSMHLNTGVTLTLSLGPIKLNCNVAGLCSFLDKVSGNSPNTGAHCRGS
jgi:hypothetical protein